MDLRAPVAYEVAVKGERCVEGVRALLQQCGKQYGFRFDFAS